VTIREWGDDEAHRFGIEVRVVNRILGPLFGYRGWFTVEEHPCPEGDIPADVLPAGRAARVAHCQGEAPR
jgi:hypothetical protein